MARKRKKIGKKIYYKKNPKAPKAVLGDVFQTALGVGQMVHGIGALRKANRALKYFDKTIIITKKSTELQKLKDEPISQKLIEGQQEQQKVTEATATGALQKTGARGLQAGIQSILKSGAQRDLALMGTQEQARQNVMGKVIAEEQSISREKSGLAREEYKGIQARRASGIENIFGGAQSALVGASTFPGGEKAIGYKDPATGDPGVNYEGQMGSRFRQWMGSQDSPYSTINPPNINPYTGQPYKKGGVTPKQEKKDIFPGRKGIFPRKGEAIKSPGKFSHKENPMDIVKDNEKVGEFTGNETIIAPKDTKVIVNLLKKGDEVSLFKHIQKLYTRFLKK